MPDELILLCRNSVLEDFEKRFKYQKTMIGITVSVRQKTYPDHDAVYHEKARLI